MSQAKGCQVYEPRALTPVWTLTGSLEVEPVGLLPLLLWCRVAELVGRVVSLQQVLDNASGFPERQASVGVLNRRDASVGIDGLERRLLQVLKLAELGGVRDSELVQDDGHFPWVGTTGVGVHLERLLGSDGCIGAGDGDWGSGCSRRSGSSGGGSRCSRRCRRWSGRGGGGGSWLLGLLLVTATDHGLEFVHCDGVPFAAHWE